MSTPPTSDPAHPDRTKPTKHPLFLRVGRFLLQCGPALVMLALTVAMIVLVNTQGRLAVVQRTYKERAEGALRSQDYRTARLCYERLMTLAQTPTGKMMATFGLAQSLEGLGASPQRVRYLLDTIAPLDGRGYGYSEAQLWSAYRILSKPSPSVKELEDAETHLKKADEGAPASVVEPKAALGQFYALTGRLNEAVPLLREVLTAHPEYRIALASIYRKLGNEQAAVDEAESAHRFYEQKLREDLSDKQARHQMVLCWMFLKNYPEANKVLREAIAREPEAAEFHALFAENCLYWSDQVAKEHPEALADQLTLIEQGLRYVPSHHGLLDRLQTFLRRPDESSDQARAVLQRLLGEGNAPAAIHFVLGADAFEHQRHDEARIHWEQAIKLAPSFTFVANNLAWVYSEAKEPELEKALDLADLAVRQQPQVPQFHGTRGHVLLRQKHYDEALTELEKALTGANKDSIDLRRDLAETYEALGIGEQAKVHRQRADELSRKSGVRPQGPPAVNAVKPNQ
jgi:tetratricopeptide (TPR) repeat protein